MQSKLQSDLVIDEKSFHDFKDFVRDQFQLDLHAYNARSLERRLQKVLRQWRIDDLRTLQMLMLRNPQYYQRFLDSFTVQVTELFREPLGFLEIRESIGPFLRRKSKIRILLAGSSTGEELSSLCILLKEEGLLEKAEILATDLSPSALTKSQQPCISKSRLKEAKMNYQRSGGILDLDEYYQSTSSLCFFHEWLFNSVSWESFNITSDELSSKFDLVICRNLLIYFKSEKQDQIIGRLLRHLNPGGFLMLGEQESIGFYGHPSRLQIVSSSQKIYRLNPSLG